MTSMLNYHPTVAGGDPPKTLHGVFNSAVADLGVVCTGAADGCLYFERTALSAHKDRDALAGEIIKRLSENGDVANWVRRQHITKIAIK